ncbi:MAG: hypothetical protein KatS3mg022_2446 [Armatimonadota bacterium]|nr:MAG: hypothetical protein KatS3mg022_2446 [Armatimonadota bacterium]
MKRFRMKKQKIVKPDGRWMYLYTFEREEKQPESEVGKTERRETETSAEGGRSG